MPAKCTSSGENVSSSHHFPVFVTPWIDQKIVGSLHSKPGDIWLLMTLRVCLVVDQQSLKWAVTSKEKIIGLDEYILSSHRSLWLADQIFYDSWFSTKGFFFN